VGELDALLNTLALIGLFCFFDFFVELLLKLLIEALERLNFLLDNFLLDLLLLIVFFITFSYAGLIRLVLPLRLDLLREQPIDFESLCSRDLCASWHGRFIRFCLSGTRLIPLKAIHFLISFSQLLSTIAELKGAFTTRVLILSLEGYPIDLDLERRFLLVALAEEFGQTKLITLDDDISLC
jgi:hypothetical protein